MTSFQRARRPEQKESRRGDMLAAASRLAAARTVRAVTLTDIAEGAGVHKSGVLRYFANREALFLELCGEQWQEWAADLARSSPDAPVGVSLAATLASRPLFCDLLAQTPLNLERSAPVEVVVSFKRGVLAAVDEAARTLADRYPELTVHAATDLVGAVTALAGALWNIAHPGDALRAAYEADPELAAACIDFLPTLEQVATALAVGLVLARR